MNTRSEITLIDMETNLEEIRNKTITIRDYFDGIDHRFQEKFLQRKQSYILEEKAKKKIQQKAKSIVIIAFSAYWCKDCADNVPILYLLGETTGIEVRVFGEIKSDPLSQVRKWRIPPSPEEMVTFKIEKLPTIIVFNEQGHELGRIVEKANIMPTLEEEISEIIESKRWNTH